MVRSYDDPVKQKARARLREFIQRNLTSFLKPERVRVVCFPGAEKRGEEGLEIKEIYDPLGIPRQNIVGLEYDRKRAERLNQADLGIRVEQMEDTDFFETTHERFHIISLDYTGQQTEERLRALANIAGRKVLHNQAVLCTNYAGKRESKEQQLKLMVRRVLFGPTNRDFSYPKFSRSPRTKGEFVDRMNEFHEHVTASSDALLQAAYRGDLEHLTWLREAISHMAIEYLTLGSMGLAYHGERPEKCFPDSFVQSDAYRRAKHQLKTNLKRDLEKDPEYRKVVELVALSHGLKSAEQIEEDPTCAVQSFAFHLLEEQATEFRNALVPNRVPYFDAFILANFVRYKESGGYNIKSTDRLAYTSNKNYLMLMDMFATEQPHRFYQAIDRTLEEMRDGRPFAYEFRGDIFRSPTWQRTLRAHKGTSFQISKSELPERDFLGSSYIRPDRIKKSDAYDLLEIGCTPKEIRECFSTSFTVGQLAAFRAHITMRENGKKATG